MAVILVFLTSCFGPHWGLLQKEGTDALSGGNDQLQVQGALPFETHQTIKPGLLEIVIMAFCLHLYRKLFRPGAPVCVHGSPGVCPELAGQVGSWLLLCRPLDLAQIYFG